MRRLLIVFFAFIMLHSSLSIPDCFADTTWQAIGPFGGIVNTIAIDPTNSQTVYAATWGNGVFKSTNGGASWTAGNSGMVSEYIKSLAIDPTNSQTVYAGTWSFGVFKSTNGGASWTAANTGMVHTNVYSLAIDPTSSQTVYAGTNGGVFKSTNGGASWTAASSGMVNINVNSVAIDPTNSQTVYAGTDAGVFQINQWRRFLDRGQQRDYGYNCKFSRHRPDQQPDGICRNI